MGEVYDQFKIPTDEEIIEFLRSYKEEREFTVMARSVEDFSNLGQSLTKN